MSESKTSVSDAYSIKTPEDSIHLYKTWASTEDIVGTVVYWGN